MNATEGMSDAELDIWTDIFYQAKVSGFADAAFSQFISNPFRYLGPATHTTDWPEKEKPIPRLAYSKGAPQNSCPAKGTE